MKPVLFFILTLIFSLPAAAQQVGAISARTEAPTLLADEGGFGFGLSEEQFIETSRRVSQGNPNFVGIKKKPAQLSPNALYGFNLSVNEKNVSWILDRDAKNDYVLYVDLNADGDLANDKPLFFEKINGRYIAEIHKILTETVDNRPRKYSYDLRLEVTERLSSDEKRTETVLRIQKGTMRRGTLKLNDRQTSFALIGSNGIYDHDYFQLYFDLDGDGKFDAENAFSTEVFRVSEKYVNLGDRTYEFQVDRYGDTLTLKPLAKKLPERANLSVDNLAPDFSFTDLDGKRRRLSDFRGKIVLIDVWALWCAPCVREAPKLAAVYQKLKDKNFEIVSLNKNDPLENLRKFIAENRMNWTHTTTDEAFLSLYRVNEFPTYFLLDKNGKIISNTLRPGEEFYRKIEELTAF